MRFYQRGNNAVVPLVDGVTIDDVLVTTREEARKKQVYFEIQRNRLRDENINFVFVNVERLRPAFKKLSLQNWGYYLLLLLRARFRDHNKRMYIGQKRKLYKVADIAELWGIKVDTAERILKKMMKEHLIQKDRKEKSFYFNDDILHKGAIKSKKAVPMSIKVHLSTVIELNKLLAKQQKTERLAMLGMIMQLLVFVERDSQLLIKDPKSGLRDEWESMEVFFSELSNIPLEHIRWQDIKELKVTKDVKTIKKYMQLLLQYGVLAEAGFAEGYVFNPLIADYRDTGNWEAKNFWLKQYPTFLKVDGKSSAKSSEIREIRPKMP